MWCPKPKDKVLWGRWHERRGGRLLTGQVRGGLKVAIIFSDMRSFLVNFTKVVSVEYLGAKVFLERVQGKMDEGTF